MKSFEELSRLCGEEKYDEAHAEIRSIEEAGFRDAALLMMKALTIQLGENGNLDEAEASLNAAAASDEAHPEAPIEAGYFQLNVRDDAKAAQPHFEAALSVLQGLVTEAVAGMALATQEAEGDAAAARFLETAARRVFDLPAIKEKLS